MTLLPNGLRDELDRHAEQLGALECDGMTKVISYLLTADGVPHTVCGGEIAIEDPQAGASLCMRPHLWVALPDGRLIDYRARMWFPQLSQKIVPHGIFQLEEYPKAAYEATLFTHPVSSGGNPWVSYAIYSVLVLTGMPFETPEEWQQYVRQNQNP